MSAKVFVGDVGTSFQVTVRDENGAVVDVSLSPSLLLIFKKPDGTNLTKTAQRVNDGTDGLIRYVTEEGDIDQPGKWLLQGYVEKGNAKLYTDVHEFRVYPNLTEWVQS